MPVTTHILPVYTMRWVLLVEWLGTGASGVQKEYCGNDVSKP